MSDESKMENNEVFDFAGDAETSSQADETTAPEAEQKTVPPAERIKVLVVDDSALVRQSLTELLETDPKIEVIGAAADPYIAAEKMREIAPDVITLDIEMPKMDGLTFLKKIMMQHPLPVIICSTLTPTGAETTLRAMEYGAVEIIQKPKVGTRKFFQESAILITDKIKAAARVRVKAYKGDRVKLRTRPKHTADVMMARSRNKAMIQTTEKVVVVGASTGGTEALRLFMETLPADAPGMVVVQHMPEHFTKAFAERLDKICEVNVKEGKDGDTVLRGQVLIAPGNYHTMLKRSGARYYIQVRQGPLVSRHRPSVDVLFRSAVRYAGKNAVGVIMTGMGDDGAHGMLEMKESGAYTIAQDEKTSVVFGMPGEAIKLQAVNAVLPIQKIAEEVLKHC